MEVICVIRDYRDSVYQKLCKQVDQINEETMNPVTDILGDILLRFKKWIHLLELDQNTKDTTKYYKSVLDMRDTTKADLKKIFEKVDAVDKGMSSDISKLNDRQNNYKSRLVELASMIKPGWKIESAQYIHERCAIYNKKIETLDKSIATDYKAELKYMMKEEALEGAKGAVGGIVKLAVDIFAMPAKWTMAFCTEGPSGLGKEAVSDTWGLINDFFGAAGNISGLAGIGVTAAIYGFTKNTAYARSGIEFLEGYTGAKDLYDVLEADEKANGESSFTSGMKTVAGTIDNIDTTVSLVTDAKNLVTKGKGILPMNPMKHTVLEKADMTEDAVEHFKHYQWLYNKLEKEGNIASTIGEVYNLGEVAYDMNQPRGVAESLGKRVANESKLVKDLGKIIDYDNTFHIQDVN